MHSQYITNLSAVSAKHILRQSRASRKSSNTLRDTPYRGAKPFSFIFRQCVYLQNAISSALEPETFFRLPWLSILKQQVLLIRDTFTFSFSPFMPTLIE